MNPIQVSPTLKSVCFNNWDEWMVVKEGLFAHQSPHQQTQALRIVGMWRQRGNIPHSVDSTANFIEIRLKDPLFSAHSNDNTSFSSSSSANSLRMLYSIAIIRAVNGLVDPGQQSYFAQSVLVLGEKLGLPGWIVELRHDGTHKRLPSMSVLRAAAQYMIDWYERNYWIPQFNNLQALMRFCLNPIIDPSCCGLNVETTATATATAAAAATTSTAVSRRSLWLDTLARYCVSPGFVSDMFLPIFVDAITALPSSTTTSSDCCAEEREGEGEGRYRDIDEIFQQHQLPLWQPVLETLSNTHSHLWMYSAISRLLYAFQQLMEREDQSLTMDPATNGENVRKSEILGKWIVHLLNKLEQQIAANASTSFSSPLELSRTGFLTTSVQSIDLYMRGQETIDNGSEVEVEVEVEADGEVVKWLQRDPRWISTWIEIQDSIKRFEAFIQRFVNSSNPADTSGASASASGKFTGSASKKRKFDKVKSQESSSLSLQELNKVGNNIDMKRVDSTENNEGLKKVSFEELSVMKVPLEELSVCEDFPVWPIGYWPGQYSCRSLLSLEVVGTKHS
jgi:hypothetical protein